MWMHALSEEYDYERRSACAQRPSSRRRPRPRPAGPSAIRIPGSVPVPAAV